MTREDINDIINAVCPNDEDYEKPCISPKYLRQELEQLALDQRQWNGEPTTKNDLGVDCISRQAVIDELKRYFHDEYYQRTSIQDCRDCFIEDVLNHLPSVTPQPRKGHWIADVDRWGDVVTTVNGYKCNKCNAFNSDKDNYCPNCGAKMESEG